MVLKTILLVTLNEGCLKMKCVKTKLPFCIIICDTLDHHKNIKHQLSLPIDTKRGFSLGTHGDYKKWNE